MTGADLHMLAGAYALGALEDDAERDAFERHLDVCESCSTEVREFLATTARLGMAVSETPPAAMRREVLSRIAQVRQEPPDVERPAAPGPRPVRQLRRAYRFALAASVAAALGLGGVAVWQYQDARDAHRQAQQAQAQAAQIAAVLAAPDARAVVGRVGGASATVVESAQLDRAVFLTPGLPELPGGKVYQLWFNDSGTMRAAGLVTPGAGQQTVLLAGSVSPAVGMGVTVEPSGGSLHPTTAPIALMAFPHA